MVVSVPVIAVFALVYRVLTQMQVTLFRPETLGLVVVCLGVGVTLGVVAAMASQTIRLVVLSVTVVLWIDTAFGLPALFQELAPERRASLARDRQRVDDIQAVQRAIEQYIRTVGPPPMPSEYGEGVGPATFWEGFWDVSSGDDNQDGRPFLDFLVEAGILPAVPVDPLNRPSTARHPASGMQYVYFVVPPGYDYEGGACSDHDGHRSYLLAVTDLENEHERPPTNHPGSGCSCLWRNAPNFFQQHFDYVVCGPLDTGARVKP